MASIADVGLDDPGFERTPYDPWVAYGRSKPANVLFAIELDRRLRDLGVRATAVHRARDRGTGVLHWRHGVDSGVHRS